MFLAYPLSGILTLLPSTNAKHAFSLLLGLWYAQEIFGNQVRWVWGIVGARHRTGWRRGGDKKGM